MCVDSVVSSVVCTSTVERCGDRKSGVWKAVVVVVVVVICGAG